jgi:gluconokinase
MVIIIMGVAGSGKTTVGQLLARSLGWDFHDGDEYHPPANVEKMSRGVPLGDADRMPWLNEISESIGRWLKENENVVLTCSALKQKYRDLLVGKRTEVRIIYLRADREVIAARLKSRKGHFAHENLLESQFADLEEPEDVITVDASAPPEEIVEKIRRENGV